jgi:hypothetical protein
MSIEDEIADLEAKLTGDLLKDSIIRDKIHQLEMKKNGATCSVDDPDCEACGS